MPRTIRAPSRLAFFLASLSCSIQARPQAISEPYKKWLNCDVDGIFSEATVGRDFSIKLGFHDAPVGNTRIALRQAGKIVATARAKSDGIAHFDRIPQGEYWPASPEGLLFPSGSLQITVKSDHASGEFVKLDWPGHSIASRHLRGRLTVSEDVNSPEIPLRNQAVELRDLYTARLIESEQTEVNGDYEFSTDDHGLYAIRVALPVKGETETANGDLAIELNPEARDLSIPEMKVLRSDCAGVQFLRRTTNDAWEEW